jgi:hypothetical protein
MLDLAKRIAKALDAWASSARNLIPRPRKTSGLY